VPTSYISTTGAGAHTDVRRPLRTRARVELLDRRYRSRRSAFAFHVNHLIVHLALQPTRIVSTLNVHISCRASRGQDRYAVGRNEY
jgi:hypothetical protein